MRMKNRAIPALAAFALFLGGARHATAGFIQNSTGLASPAATITFEEHVYANDTALTAQYSDLGVTFGSGVYYTNQYASAGFVNYSDDGIKNFLAFDVIDSNAPFSIFFSTPQTAAAFAMIVDGGTGTFTALLGGVPVETDTVLTTYSAPNDYFGFTGIVFDEIIIDPSNTDHAMTLDNLQLGEAASAAPEPATITMLGMGVAGLAGCRLRRRKEAAAAV